ncbi:hypothetical protein [Nocardia sp. X0981]
MGDTRRVRRPGATGTVFTRIGGRLSEGLLRSELLVAAVVLSSFTLVIGLTSDSAAWKVGYCVAGGSGIAASFAVMRREQRWQWLESVGIAVGNVVLLAIYGRLSGDV